MNRLGIQSLNAGAPDLRLSGDQTQRGTYTQRRRNQMAYGGIAGLDGRKAYGIGSWFQEKIKDPIKEKVVDPLIDLVTDNPMASTLVGGALVNQFGIPFTGQFTQSGNPLGENWLGNLLGGYDTVIGGPGEQGKPLSDIWTNLFPDAKQPAWQTPGINPYGQADTIGMGSMDDAGLPENWGDILIESTMKNQPGLVGEAMKMLGRQNYGDLKDTGLQTLYNKFLGNQQQQQQQQTGQYPIRWKEPLAIGTAIGAADYLTRSDDKMPEQLSIDPSRFATAAAAKADPLLRFKPQEQYTLKDGGRIGYAGGKYLSNKDWLISKGYSDMMKGMSDEDIIQLYDSVRGTWSKAQGGRIGYQNAGDVEIPEVDTEGILKKLENFRKKRQDYEDAIFRSKRIEAQEGGLMNLGGMEKDYRQEGGFVPIGAKEKADDVPARLSKNEFVFTADAVRSAGGGDIDEGAAVMERLMENLEAGGKVSEDSQGLEGAQAMFANTQRLQNRII